MDATQDKGPGPRRPRAATKPTAQSRTVYRQARALKQVSEEALTAAVNSQQLDEERSPPSPADAPPAPSTPPAEPPKPQSTIMPEQPKPAPLPEKAAVQAPVDQGKDEAASPKPDFDLVSRNIGLFVGEGAKALTAALGPLEIGRAHV